MTWRQVTLAIWVLIGAALVAAHVAAKASRGRLPTLDALLRAGTARPVIRAALLLGWMWLGWHAFAR